jgi:hypothetical protein
LHYYEIFKYGVAKFDHSPPYKECYAFYGEMRVAALAGAPTGKKLSLHQRTFTPIHTTGVSTTYLYNLSLKLVAVAFQ